MSSSGSPGGDHRGLEPSGAPSSRAGSSATRRSPTSPGSTPARRRPSSCATEFIEADLRSSTRSRASCPPPRSTPSCTAGSSGTRSRGARPGPARDQRDRDAPTARRLRASADDPARVIVRGSAAIYGCEGAAPLLLHGGSRPGGAAADPVSARHLRARGLLRQLRPPPPRTSPAACCATSPRSAAGLESPLVRYLTLPVVPVQLGFDPRLQFLHADDATGALVAAVREPGSRARSTSRPTARSR